MSELDLMFLSFLAVVAFWFVFIAVGMGLYMWRQIRNLDQ